MAAALDQRGRHADSPDEIPAPGWRDILWRVHKHAARERLGIAAAGVAFYALMSLFPTLIAIIGIYGMVYTPDEITRHVALISTWLPPRAADLFTAQMEEIIGLNSMRWRIGSLAAVLLALWAASAGMRALLNGLNITYHEETGPILRFYLKSFVFTLGAVLSAMASLFLIFGLPVVLRYAGLEAGVLVTLRWALLAGAAMLGLAILYRYGPSRRMPRWRWVSPGAAIATGLWVIASALFSMYVVNFDRYNATYGSIGAVLVVLTWFLITAWAILLGSEINAQMERQTEEDTTEGPRRPLGQRGARAADTVGSEH
ncbi:MAG TPA: YihY/virulence factor BrkB family protein [Burkholderiales bacterium]|nr:YihY/virulence factor BrkB family protein [Burkholderiales bacterium]